MGWTKLDEIDQLIKESRVNFEGESCTNYMSLPVHFARFKLAPRFQLASNSSNVISNFHAPAAKINDLLQLTTNCAVSADSFKLRTYLSVDF
jgi:hypothetical protein